MEIADWRKKIDELDEQITALLNRRAAAAVEIGKIKLQNTAPIYEPKREQQVYEHVRSVNAGPLTATEVQDIFERIMDVMRNKQKQ
jgi:chorismate mutase